MARAEKMWGLVTSPNFGLCAVQQKSVRALTSQQAQLFNSRRRTEQLLCRLKSLMKKRATTESQGNLVGENLENKTEINLPSAKEPLTSESKDSCQIRVTHRQGIYYERSVIDKVFLN